MDHIDTHLFHFSDNHFSNLQYHTSLTLSFYSFFSLLIESETRKVEKKSKEGNVYVGGWMQVQKIRTMT